MADTRLPPPDPAEVFGKEMPTGSFLQDPVRGTLEVLPALRLDRPTWDAAAAAGLLAILAAVAAAQGHALSACLLGPAIAVLPLALRLRAPRTAARLILGSSGLIYRRPRTRVFVPWSIVEDCETGGVPHELRLRVRVQPFGPFAVSETFAPWPIRLMVRGQYRLRHELPDRRIVLRLGPGHDLEALRAAVRWFVRATQARRAP
ncbi:MAG: hypothetical protein HYZ53_00595 [Planctomycetes bacterium]|nr:hypothetical protein [Planctomycetota bacterium]